MTINAASSVLILTEDYDPTTDQVVSALEHRHPRVPVFRADAADFPAKLRMSAILEGAGRWSGTLRTSRRTLDLSSVRSVFYRRPTQFRLDEGMSEAERMWAGAQARLGFGGVILDIPAQWVNHPARVAEAEYKPVQLASLARAGLRVPATLITADPVAVREFATRVAGPIVHKPLYGWALVEDGQVKTTYVDRLTPDVLDDLAGVEQTAHMFQAWVAKRRDARVVVVGQQVMAVEIHTESPSAHVDWRVDYDSLTYHPVAVPDPIVRAIHRYMAASGLLYASADFGLTGDPADPDVWWCYEFNPAGQWGWLDDHLPIAAAMANLLAQEDRA